jgi:hypothetical protein
MTGIMAIAKPKDMLPTHTALTTREMIVPTIIRVRACIDCLSYGNEGYQRKLVALREDLALGCRAKEFSECVIRIGVVLGVLC